MSHKYGKIFTYKILPQIQQNNAVFKKKYLLLIWIVFLCVFSKSSFSQPFHTNSFNPHFSNSDSEINKPGCNFHTSIRPFYQNQYSQIQQTDSLILENKNYSDLFSYKTDSLAVIFNPLFALIPSINFNNSEFSVESNIGISLKTQLHKNTVFASDLLYNYSLLNTLQLNIADSLHIVPGQGYAHSSKMITEYFNNSFYLAYTPSKYFTLETGMGKNFWGDGYRSMILSNNAYNYPYIKFETNILKIKYLNLWANFKDIRNYNSSVWNTFQNKFGTFHFLSWNISKRLNLGLYEAVLWQYGSESGIRGFDVNYANPLVFYRPVEFSLGSPDNAFMGLNLKYIIGKNTILYAQYLIDDMVLSEMKNDIKHLIYQEKSTSPNGSWFNKQAYQAGIKFFNFLNIKNLYFQTECNAAKPYTYSHRNVMLNFGHFNQSLAHPLGANFVESFSIIRYAKHKFHFEFKFMYALTGLDFQNSHVGSNIYKSTFDTYIPEEKNIPVQQYGNYITQGIPSAIVYSELKITYLMNKKNNLRAEAGYIFRNQTTEMRKTLTDNYFFIGVRTSIFNGYNDF